MHRSISTCVFAASLIVGMGATAAARPAPTLNRHSAAQHHGGWMARDANPKHVWMYTAGQNQQAVLIYDLDLFGTPQIGEIDDGVNGPNQATIDSAGTVYVANVTGGNVTIYPAGALSPSLTLQGLTRPCGVAIDTNGDVYVTNRAATPSINVYAQGQTTPYRVITSNLIQVPTEPQFDDNRNLYVSDNVTNVIEVPFGGQPVSLGLEDLPGASGLAIDPLNGDLFVSNNTTRVYAPGAVKPKRILQTADQDELAIGTVRGTEYLFAANHQTEQVLIFKHDAKKATGSLPTGASDLIGVGIKPAGVP
jgi:hypothetical protein